MAIVNSVRVESGESDTNKGTSPPPRRGGCATNKMDPFLSGRRRGGQTLLHVPSATDLPRRAENKERYIFLDRRVDPSSKEGMCPCSCLAGLILHSALFVFCLLDSISTAPQIIASSTNNSFRANLPSDKTDASSV